MHWDNKTSTLFRGGRLSETPIFARLQLPKHLATSILTVYSATRRFDVSACLRPLPARLARRDCFAFLEPLFHSHHLLHDSSCLIRKLCRLLRQGPCSLLKGVNETELYCSDPDLLRERGNGPLCLLPLSQASCTRFRHGPEEARYTRSSILRLAVAQSCSSARQALHLEASSSLGLEESMRHLLNAGER